MLDAPGVHTETEYAAASTDHTGSGGGEADKEVEKCAGRAEGGAEVIRRRELEGG